MAVLLGSVKLSEMSEGKIFVDKEDGHKIRFLNTKTYYRSSERKNIRYVYFYVLTGKNANVVGHTTLAKFKKEYKAL